VDLILAFMGSTHMFKEVDFATSDDVVVIGLDIITQLSVKSVTTK